MKFCLLHNMIQIWHRHLISIPFEDYIYPLSSSQLILILSSPDTIHQNLCRYCLVVLVFNFVYNVVCSNKLSKGSTRESNRALPSIWSVIGKLIYTSDCCSAYTFAIDPKSNMWKPKFVTENLRQKRCNNESVWRRTMKNKTKWWQWQWLLNTHKFQTYIS